MELKPSSIEEQKKDFKRDFSSPQFYVCEITNKDNNQLVGALPFMVFHKLDAMVIINSLAAQIGIPSKDINFVALENSIILVSATAESEKFKLTVSIQDLEKLQKEESEEKAQEESKEEKE